MFEVLSKNIQERAARIGVIGLGYVGLPLILRLLETGFPVTGFDVNVQHLEKLRSGNSPFTHIPDEKVISLTNPSVCLTSDFSDAQHVDALIICLPTPLDRYRQPDLSYITSSMQALAPFLHPGMLVSLESTTWPGTTEEILRPIIEATGLQVGRDVALVFSPEREDPGNAHFTIREIPKVVGGVTASCLDVGKTFYGTIVDTVVPVSSTRVAEMTKLLENIQRSVNIGLMNEMKMISEAMEINIFEVISAASTKPFGFTPYFPGPGLGGHCIPIDPFYLTWKAREYGLHTRFIELSGEVNSSMPQYVIDRLTRALSEVSGLAVRGSRVLIIGLAYKKNINDIRESPALEILLRLRERGCEAEYHDPFCPIIPPTRQYGAIQGAQSHPLEPGYDATVIVTDHDSIDWHQVSRTAPIVVDTRNVMSRVDFDGERRLIRA